MKRLLCFLFVCCIGCSSFQKESEDSDRMLIFYRGELIQTLLPKEYFQLYYGYSLFFEVTKSEDAGRVKALISADHVLTIIWYDEDGVEIKRVMLQYSGGKA
ncbi:MAG: hypothetical protein GY853_01345 [PVC group bacterium]|nr:hypothetical protein [PVC group bacterium]